MSTFPMVYELGLSRRSTVLRRCMVAGMGMMVPYATGVEQPESTNIDD